MCIYTYTYVYIYMYIHVYMYVYIYIYIYICMYVCMHGCMYVQWKYMFVLRIKPECLATVPICMCQGFEIALGSHVLHPCQSHSPGWCWVAVTGCNHCTRRSQARTRRLCKGFLARNREHGAVLCLQSPFLQTRTYMKSSATPCRFIWQPGRTTRDHTYVRARLFHLFLLPIALAFLARMEMQQLKGALAENKRSCRLPPI